MYVAGRLAVAGHAEALGFVFRVWLQEVAIAVAYVPHACGRGHTSDIADAVGRLLRRKHPMLRAMRRVGACLQGLRSGGRTRVQVPNVQPAMSCWRPDSVAMRWLEGPEKR